MHEEPAHGKLGTQWHLFYFDSAAMAINPPHALQKKHGIRRQKDPRPCRLPLGKVTFELLEEDGGPN